MSEAREPFEWVEIDQDFCTRTYSSAPCTASLTSGSTECYNTRSTCQDPANYDRGIRTLRFCKNQAFLPDDGNYYMPTLVSASLSAGSINPVGAASTSSALGTRGGLSVRFQDGPHTDRYVDPYIANRVSRDAGYIATERGTFWSKWRARNQYYLGRVIRHKTGFIDPNTRTVVDVVTRTYFITGFDGPDASGAVSMSAKDILSQFANDKAKVPAASNGRLLNDLTNVATSLVLDPVGISSEYDASGYIRIGSEIMAYTKGSGDTLNITRAQYGSTAGTGKAGDVVQVCKVYSAQTPAAILTDLLTTYAAIPSGYLDTAQWAQEQTDYMPRLYSTVISEPTGVQEVIAEMCEQMYFYLIWDERNALLKLRAIRPAQDDTIYDLSDFTNFVSDSIGLRDLNDQLYTQVWVYYGLINYAASAKEEKNYAVREIIATDEGGADKQDFERIKKIYCRWIPSTNGAAALDLGQKMIARYGAAPRQVSFSLTGKDSAIWIGDFVTVSHRLSVDATGAELPLNIQVMSAQESRAGTEFRYVGQEFVYEAPVDVSDKLILITADQENINLRDVYDSQFGVAPVSGDNIRFEIRSGVAVGGRTADDLEGYIGEQGPLDFIGGSVQSVAMMPWANKDVSSRTLRARGAVYDGAAMASDMWEVPVSVGFDTGLWPSGVTISITINPGAAILGEGGFVGMHTNNTRVFVSDGGHAMRIRHPVSINNGGVIAGGGAGGFMFNAAWGGAGAGYANGTAIPQTDDPLNPADFGQTATVVRSAAIGSRTAPGTGSVVRYSASPSSYYDNTGLTGGGLGLDTRSSGDTTNRGGRAGNAIIEGASLITWINKGDVRGAEVA